MTTDHEPDYARRVTRVAGTRFLANSTIEIIRQVQLTKPPRYALFDFDGTLSLVREGWPEVMVPMMVEILRETGTEETDAQLHDITMNFVMELLFYVVIPTIVYGFFYVVIPLSGIKAGLAAALLAFLLGATPLMMGLSVKVKLPMPYVLYNLLCHFIKLGGSMAVIGYLYSL